MYGLNHDSPFWREVKKEKGGQPGDHKVDMEQHHEALDF